MDDDDPIIDQKPVYLSQALSQNLYIYQYPVRPANRDWNDVNVINAAIKPQNRMVRMEVALDTYSEKYCPSKGEQIAINTDGQQESTWHIKEKDKSLYFKRGTMDKIVYESSAPCTETKHFAIAMLQDNELHCTPIQGIIQMRPSYSYFDKQDKRRRDRSKEDGSDNEEKELEAQQVTVKFARQETDMAKKVREKSYETISQRAAEEPWYDALWKDSESDHADLERLKLFSATTSDGSSLNLRPKEYVRALVPPPPEDEADVAPSKKPSPEEQVKEILLNAKVMPFNELRALVRTEEGMLSESALISVLTGAACCVRGVWTARSAALYTRGGAVPPRLMAAARDHVLFLFTKQSYIDRRKVTASLPLPPLEVLEVIRSVAKFNSKTGWELLVPPDLAFESKHPELMKRQNLYWEGLQKQFVEMIAGDIVPKRQRKKSQRDSIGSDAMLSPKPRCNSVSEEDSDKKRSKKQATGGKRTRHLSSSAQDAT